MREEDDAGGGAAGETGSAADETGGSVDGAGRSGDATDESEETAEGAENTSEAPSNVDADGAAELTHTTSEGDVQMVDVGAKPDTERRAVAAGEIHLRPETVAAISADEVGKGDVLATARVGAIQAVKHTWETVPMCHQIPITNVETAFAVEKTDGRIDLEVVVETTGKTGCEMEALEGVTTGLNVVWDMVKAIEKDEEGGYPATRIENVRVLEKEKTESATET